MSERTPPAAHLDPDRLSAFIEGALTEAERQESLAHLAECADCRNVLFLAQHAVPDLQPAPHPAATPGWRRWLPPLSLAAGAVACGVIVILWMHPHSRPSSTQNVELARQAAPSLPPASPSAAAAPLQPKPAPVRQGQAFTANRPEQLRSSIQPLAAAPTVSTARSAGALSAKAAQPEAAQGQPERATDQTQTAVASSGSALNSLVPAPPAASGPAAQQAAGSGAAIAANPALAPAPNSATSAIHGAFTAQLQRNGLLDTSDELRLTIEHNHGPDNGLSAISGTVTDASAAVIPKAFVTLRSASGEMVATALTDGDGRFSLTSVAPGEYQIQISASGFMTRAQRLDLQARDLALLSPTLRVGSASQTVEVMTSSTALQTTSPRTDADLAAIIPVLPGKLPALKTAIGNGRILALDPAGTLYVSHDAGRRWRKIRPVWTGSIVHLAASSGAATSDRKTPRVSRTKPVVFELTTSDGAIWISSDGSHWRLR